MQILDVIRLTFSICGVWFLYSLKYLCFVSFVIIVVPSPHEVVCQCLGRLEERMAYDKCLYNYMKDL